MLNFNSSKFKFEVESFSKSYSTLTVRNKFDDELVCSYLFHKAIIPDHQMLNYANLESLLNDNFDGGAEWLSKSLKRVVDERCMLTTDFVHVSSNMSFESQQHAVQKMIEKAYDIVPDSRCKKVRTTLAYFGRDLFEVRFFIDQPACRHFNSHDIYKQLVALGIPRFSEQQQRIFHDAFAINIRDLLVTRTALPGFNAIENTIVKTTYELLAFGVPLQCFPQMLCDAFN